MKISLAATVSPTAVLDEAGDILGVNRAWKRFGNRNGLAENYTVEGKNYVTVSQQASDQYGNRVANELSRLLNEEQSAFTVVYPCHSPDQQRWFRLSGTTVSFGEDRYYILIHQQLTDGSSSTNKQSSEVVETPTASSNHRNQGRLVTYAISSDETASEGLLMAFDAIGIDTQRQETTLQDWIDSDVINTLQSSTNDFHLTFRIWDYPVGLTPKKAIIYSPEHSSE